MTRWIGRVLFAACVWGLLLGYANLDNRQLHPLGLAGAVAAVLAVAWLCMDAYKVAGPPQWLLYHSHSAVRMFDPRFSRLSQELAEASSRQAAALAVHTSVVNIADTILLDVYGVDRLQDRDAAARILGDDTMAYLSAGPSRTKDVFSESLFAVLSRLESL